MLYGNLIFIKKTGGDGSKYPVTERDIKIGRSDKCLIRIYNPQVALEHCQLIIKPSGQATLRNLSNQTILNGKPLTQEDVILCHGDIFQLGERLARWEYLPTSKFYKQLLSPTGRLVAVVMPQQRSLEDQETPGTSASQVSVLKTTPLGKRRFSEKTTSDNLSAVKIRKSNGSELIHRGPGDLKKLLTGRHSFRTAKLLLKGTNVKERKSISGIVSSKSSKGKVKGKYRKSLLPSWKINIVSPRGKKSSGSKKSLRKSNEKSGNAVRTLVKDVTGSNPDKFLQSESNTGIKTPHKIVRESKFSEELIKSSSSPLKTKIESPSKSTAESTRSARSLSKSPSLKKSSLKSPSKVVLSTPKQKSKFAGLVHSESKLKSTSVKPSVFCKANKGMSLILEKIDSIPRQSLIKEFRENVTQEKTKTPKIRLSGIIPDSITQIPLKANKMTPRKRKRNSLKNTSIKSTPKELEKKPRKSSANETLKSTIENKEKTSRKNITLKENLTQKPSKTPRTRTVKEVNSDSVDQSSSLIDLEYESNPKKQKFTPRKSAYDKSNTPKCTPAKSTKNYGKAKMQSPDSQRSMIILKETVSSASPSSTDKHGNSTSVLSKRGVSSKKLTSFSKTTVSQRGIRRKLSPSSSADRAAKKLKISSPKKPDKNKKAALLVLGKANRKLLASQNLKVLLKQKILKKAIKQSSAVSARDDKSRTKNAAKLKKKTSRPKSKKFKKKDSSSESSTLSKDSATSDVLIVKLPNEENTQEATPRSKKVSEIHPSLFSKGKITESIKKSDSRQTKGSEFSQSMISSGSFTQETSLSSNSFEKSAESFLFNSNRRCSKRLSSKNDTGRPDFIELSPTALGLIPKNVEVFKTPRDNRRRSSSLVTPKNIQTTGIIKSASTSKIGNRKSVRFSSKDVSINSGFCSPNVSEKSDFDYSAFHTPNITVDVFVSPFTDKITWLKKDLSNPEVTFLKKETSSSSILNRKSNSVPKTCVRKLLQSPQSKINLSEAFSCPSELTNSLSLGKVDKHSRSACEKSPKNEMSESLRIPQELGTQKIQKSCHKNLSNLSGVSRLLRTAKNRKSPKNDLTDVSEVKRLLKTPKVQKSPKNDLSDVRGVKKLLQTPKVQKSPKNDLSDVRGVKKLLQTPKVQKSPKNDLSDVMGIKKLLQTPNIQKSPKNDLTDVRGVKKLLRTPKAQKSPKNDLSDVRGVKKLLQTPRVQKSPKNDLSDIRGIKRLLRSPEVQKSPKNDLTDVAGVKQLFKSPRVQKDPKNELSDVTGVRELFSRHKPISDYNINLCGVPELFDLPKTENLEQKESIKVPLRHKKMLKNENHNEAKETKIITRGSRLRKATNDETKSKRTRNKKSEIVTNLAEKKPIKRKAAEKVKISRSKKSSTIVKSSKKTTASEKLQTTKKAGSSEEDKNEMRSSRKRKILSVDLGISPPRLRRKVVLVEKPNSKETATSKKTITRSTAKRSTRKESPVTSAQKVSVKAKSKSKTSTASSKAQSKAVIKSGAKGNQKVQRKKFQTPSKKNVSSSSEKLIPRKTQSAKVEVPNQNIAKTRSQDTGENGVKSGAGRKKLSPVVRRSTRRK